MHDDCMLTKLMTSLMTSLMTFLIVHAGMADSGLTTDDL